ncbi:MAG: DUF5678 domain-containing protein [Planctomycetota bacterium]
MESADFNWLTEKSTELFEMYRGKWIAVHDGEVIGVGDTAPEAAAAAREKSPEAEFILEAVDAEADVIYGSL